MKKQRLIHVKDITEPAIRMIRDEYSRSFTIDELAKECNVSKFHFCRVFKEKTGLTPTEYIKQNKISKI